MITEHFALEEFDGDGPVSVDAAPVLYILCADVLEPVREFCGTSLLITSGNRPLAANRAAHGQPNSEHIYSAEHAACDFFQSDKPMREVFDWMRRNPRLPFHQLILEHSPKGGSVIHVSVNITMKGIRSVLEGSTHNSGPYTKMDYVAFNAAGDLPQPRSGPAVV